jgi:hypothetical protein
MQNVSLEYIEDTRKYRTQALLGFDVLRWCFGDETETVQVDLVSSYFLRNRKSLIWLDSCREKAPWSGRHADDTFHPLFDLHREQSQKHLLRMTMIKNPMDEIPFRFDAVVIQSRLRLVFCVHRYFIGRKPSMMRYHPRMMSKWRSELTFPPTNINNIAAGNVLYQCCIISRSNWRGCKIDNK